MYILLNRSTLLHLYVLRFFLRLIIKFLKCNNILIYIFLSLTEVMSETRLFDLTWWSNFCTLFYILVCFCKKRSLLSLEIKSWYFRYLTFTEIPLQKEIHTLAFLYRIIYWYQEHVDIYTYLENTLPWLLSVPQRQPPYILWRQSSVHPQRAYLTSTFQLWSICQSEQRVSGSFLWCLKNGVACKE